MKIIAISNQKGGVGKTTTAINLAVGLANLGKNVLVIDLDSQAHLTAGFGINPDKINSTIFQVFLDEILLEDILVRKYGLDIAPANIDLAGADLKLSGVYGREFLLREALGKTKKEYDLAIIDCPPNLSLITVNALAICDYVFVPLQAEYFAARGLGQLMDTVKIIKSKLNHKIEIGGIIATRFDKRKNLSKEIKSKVDEIFGKNF